MRKRILFIAFALFMASGLFAQQKSQETQSSSSSNYMSSSERSKAKAEDLKKVQEEQFAKQREEKLKQLEETMKQKEDIINSFEFDFPATYLPGEGVYFVSDQSQSSSQITLRKTFKGETKTSDGTFSVEEGVVSIKISIRGEVETGEIVVTIRYPNGDVMKKLTLDDSALISMDQSIRISGTDKKYYGEWNYSVKANNANGNYRLSISTR